MVHPWWVFEGWESNHDWIVWTLWACQRTFADFLCFWEIMRSGTERIGRWNFKKWDVNWYPFCCDKETFFRSIETAPRTFWKNSFSKTSHIYSHITNKRCHFFIWILRLQPLKDSISTEKKTQTTVFVPKDHPRSLHFSTPKSPSASFFVIFTRWFELPHSTPQSFTWRLKRMVGSV